MVSFSRFVRYWLPAIVWMILIFTLSSRQRIVLSNEATLNFLIFKMLHMIEYATLYFLLFRGFYSLKNKDINPNQKLFYPMICAILYACSDELHQTFVPTREGAVRDVVIDTIGIFFMYIYIKGHIGFVKKFI